MPPQIDQQDAPEDQAAPIVEFRQVGLRYGRGPEVLQEIDLSLPYGSFHFLTGSSGAGKSSLLGLMYFARRPTSGSIRMFGIEADRLPRRKLPEVRRQIGVVFQDFRLLDHLTALDNVALPLRIAGLPEPDIRRNVTELLEWVGLGDHLRARPPTMSGGQQQRVAIARAVVATPNLLLADEPTGSVDDHSAARLMRLFEELNRMGTTIVIATHNRAIVEASGHPELRLEDGQLSLIPGRLGA